MPFQERNCLYYPRVWIDLTQRKTYKNKNKNKIANKKKIEKEKKGLKNDKKFFIAEKRYVHTFQFSFEILTFLTARAFTSNFV